ncbi:hypothetical protein [Methylomagnum sp.]
MKLNPCNSALAAILTVFIPVCANADNTGNDVLDMTLPAILSLSHNSATAVITFTSAPISERCAISWDDSYQLTGTFRKRDDEPSWYPATHPEWKKLRHCVNVVTNGPTEVGTLDNAAQYIVEGIKVKMNACINDVLNEDSTLRLFALVAAIATDILTEGGTGGGATTGVILE